MVEIYEGLITFIKRLNFEFNKQYTCRVYQLLESALRYDFNHWSNGENYCTFFNNFLRLANESALRENKDTQIRILYRALGQSHINYM